MILQQTFAGLVADAAVDRVVEQDELQDLLALFAHRVRTGQHAHAFGHRHVAGDVGPAVAAAFGLDLDHADAAVAGHRQARVPAEIRDEETGSERRLQHGLASVRVDRLAIDEEIRHSPPPLPAGRRTSTAYWR